MKIRLAGLLLLYGTDKHGEHDYHFVDIVHIYKLSFLSSNPLSRKLVVPAIGYNGTKFPRQLDPLGRVIYSKETCAKLGLSQGNTD
jgi:hypothetical protein